MDVKTLLKHFSSFTTLPIDPDDVIKELKSHGIKDEIEFVGVSLDVLIVRGSLYHYVRPSGVYSPPVLCAEIYYNLNQERRWRRLVCCKELIHILDRTPSRTTDQQGLEKLLRDMADPSKMTFVSADNVASWTDYFTEFHAIAVLFPIEAREVLLPAYRAGKMTLADISDRADLPEEVVGVVMSDQWPVIYSALNGSS